MAKRNGPGGPRNSDTDELPKAKLNLVNLKKSLRLFSYLDKQKWKFILGMFFLAGSAGIGLIFPLKSGEMFGFFGETTQPVEEIKNELINIGLVLLAILFIQALFFIWQSSYVCTSNRKCFKGNKKRYI